LPIVFGVLFFTSDVVVLVYSYTVNQPLPRGTVVGFTCVFAVIALLWLIRESILWDCEKKRLRSTDVESGLNSPSGRLGAAIVTPGPVQVPSTVFNAPAPAPTNPIPIPNTTATTSARPLTSQVNNASRASANETKDMNTAGRSAEHTEIARMRMRSRGLDTNGHSLAGGSATHPSPTTVRPTLPSSGQPRPDLTFLSPRFALVTNLLILILNPLKFIVLFDQALLLPGPVNPCHRLSGDLRLPLVL